MQRVANYGSFLQAYGLKKTIESMGGYDVVFIDYKNKAPVVPYSRRKWFKHLLRQFTLVAWAEDEVYFRGTFRYQYRHQFLPMLGISYRRNPRARADVAVIGSDEVFNCLQSGVNVGFSPMLFGQGIRAKKVISYAASCGYTDIEGIDRYGLRGQLGAYLDTFSALSVRDKNTRDVVKSLTGREPEMNLDPVLISDYELPEGDLPIHDYVILYTYPSCPYSEQERAEILEFCRRNGKKLVSFGAAQSWVDIRMKADPFELLRYFQEADFIITDTFHGSIFSIKYNKNFAVVIRPTNKQKLGDLLSRLHMQSRQITDFDQLQERYDTVPDYAGTNAVIAEEKEHALCYLRQNLRM